MIQKTVGSLNFICQAIPARKPFLAGLHCLTRFPNGSKRKLGNHRRINNETYEDLKIFESFLQTDTDEARMVPFLNKLQVFNNDIELYADAAGSVALGFGCFFQGQWCQGMWKDMSLFEDSYKPNIALLELFAIVIAVELWAPQLSGWAITLRTDNMATVVFINKMKADIPACMKLLRHVTLTCLKFQILLRARHIKGVNNLESDWISHGMNQKFLECHPEASAKPLAPPRSLWPPTWTVAEMSRYPRENP